MLRKIAASLLILLLSSCVQTPPQTWDLPRGVKAIALRTWKLPLGVKSTRVNGYDMVYVEHDNSLGKSGGPVFSQRSFIRQ
jgi:hypothetical protein